MLLLSIFTEVSVSVHEIFQDQYILKEIVANPTIDLINKSIYSNPLYSQGLGTGVICEYAEYVNTKTTPHSPVSLPHPDG